MRYGEESLYRLDKLEIPFFSAKGGIRIEPCNMYHNDTNFLLFDIEIPTNHDLCPQDHCRSTSKSSPRVPSVIEWIEGIQLIDTSSYVEENDILNTCRFEADMHKTSGQSGQLTCLEIH